VFAKAFTIFFAATIALGFALYTPVQAQYVQDGMIGYWSFDASTIDGDTIKDLSGNGNDGIINFDVKIVEGKIGDALEFDGVDNHYVDTGMMVTEEQYESLTMMAWAKPYMVDDYYTQIMGCDDGGWDRGYGYWADEWCIQVGHGGDWMPGDIVDIDEWQHTAVIYTPDNVYFYKDNQKSEFGKRTTPTTSANPLIIGGDIPCGPCFVTGAIDEVMVYDHALTDAEIERNFNAKGFAVDAAGKLALTWGAIKASR
jgi:hypothetical protein